jgi:hypothetical protein
MYKLAPLIIILLYMRTQPDVPVTQIGISDEFEIDRKTAAASLRQLASHGMIAHLDHNNGYVLAQGGLQMLLDLDAGWGKNGHLTLKESFKDLKDSKDKKERKSQMGKKWTAPEGLTTERILAETGKLFGFEVVLHGVANCDPGLTMTLIAHAYDQRARLRKPQIFVYRRMQRNEQPDRKYQQDPLQFLPNEFLHALGLAELRIVDVDPGDDIVDADEVVDDQDAGAVAVWEIVLRDIMDGMPHGTLRNAVEDARPLSLSNGLLRIRCSTQAEQELLDSRLTSTINRLLIGITNAHAKVEFVAVETEEG